MFAIVEAGGRQFKLEPGRFVDIDRTDDQEGSEHVFDKVLMLVDGDKSTVGTPYVEGAAVQGKVISNLKENAETGRITSSIRSKKVIVYKHKPKKGTRRKQGHRQQFTRVMIDSIKLKDKTVAEAKG